MIKPTVGRIVHYHETGTVLENVYRRDAQPLAAIVAYAWDDGRVNLTVFDPMENSFARQYVLLRQEGDPMPPFSYCEEAHQG